MSDRESPTHARDSTSRQADVMSVLDLFIDVAYHDGGKRDLAVAAEAYTLAGFHDGAIDISHAAEGETRERIAQARKGLTRRLLRAEARGLLLAAHILLNEQMLSGSDARWRTNERWQERGGHKGKIVA